MRRLHLLLAASLFVIAPPVLAGEAPVTAAPASEAVQAAALSFERVFASPNLNGPAPRGVKLSPDGRFITMLRGREDDRLRYDLWAFDRQSGTWAMLVDSLKLQGKELSEAEKMQRERARIGDLKGIVTYQWTADAKALLVPVDGALYLARIGGEVTALSGGEGDALNPEISPKGGYLSYVRGGRLHVGKLGTLSAPITPPEASDTVHWGEAEFVAQEEMDRDTGYWWAPDDSRIAVARFDEAPVGVITRAAIGADGTKTYAQRYPLAGTANAAISLHVMNPDGSGRVEVELGADKDIYLARVDWAKDGKTLYVQRQNRAQTRLDLLGVDPATGSARVLLSEQAPEKAWVNLSNSYRMLADGSMIWWSERSGFGHLYHFKAGKLRQLTKGEWVVTKLVGLDEKRGVLFFQGTLDDVLAQQVYALDYRKPGKPRRLTEPGFVHDAGMDTAGQTLLITRSSPDQPPQTYAADAAGKRLAWVEENAMGPAHPYGPYLAGHAKTQFGTISADDGTVLHYKLILPEMEPGKRYPVFFQHYGGPHAQNVTRGWGGGLVQALVGKGYIYFELDNRGTANRGLAFETPLWRAMGGVEVADQLAGARFIKGLPFVDPAKIATYGWSYGGYMTLKMLAANPGVYAAGIAGAPVTRWELYDTHYTERYMGDPRQVPGAYEKAGVMADAGKIKDPLLLIHGMADDNVVFENTSALVARLQNEAAPFEMMLYPGHTHRVAGPKISVHLWNTILAFLERRGVTPPQ